MHFTTGADVIDVEFTDLRGLRRYPVAHTCGPLLKIPCAYSTYSEFLKRVCECLRCQLLENGSVVLDLLKMNLLYRSKDFKTKVI